MQASPESQDRRPGVRGVHSLDRFVLTVPDLDEAVKFFTKFGLDVRAAANRVDLYAHGHPHHWASVYANGRPRKLQYISFGIYPEDEAAFRDRIASLGIGCEPHPLSDRPGIWMRDPDGVATQLVVAAKVAPSRRATALGEGAPGPGYGAATPRSKAPPVQPRRLSHVLRFSPDVPRMRAFCEQVLGLRLADHSGDFIAFLYGVHGSDHHLCAFVKSNGPGFHHSSWDVRSIDEVGWGAETLRAAGYDKGWGVGRHVLGSNYFYYARDPWGSFAEYSFDIDHVPATVDWQSGDHAPEDSFYLWGPQVPEYFTENPEASS